MAKRSTRVTLKDLPPVTSRDELPEVLNYQHFMAFARFNERKVRELMGRSDFPLLKDGRDLFFMKHDFLSWWDGFCHECKAAASTA